MPLIGAGLEQVIQKDRPAFIYTIPNFHNPTGNSMSQGKREKLLIIFEIAVYRIDLLIIRN